ncbi:MULTISPECIES: ArsR/SmtB family transcription factor [Acetobacteraceae]|nr:MULTISPECIES: metalloregulator ArsR/SmtB family transcription factor [Acetobacteraceae]MDN7351422.1 metalloregulator ArsR/SmtB family transcription factor [Acetobacter senegalensis]
MKKQNPLSPPVEAMQQHAAKAESLLKELANANRLMVLCHLVSGEKTVSNIVDTVGLSQSALSQHLARLKEAGLVESEKRGLMVYYRLCSVEVQALLAVLHLIFCREPTLD